MTENFSELFLSDAVDLNFCGSESKITVVGRPSDLLLDLPDHFGNIEEVILKMIITSWMSFLDESQQP